MNEKTNENRAALPKFLLIILVSAVAGGVIGFGSAAAADSGLGPQLAAGLNRLLSVVTPWAIPVASAVTLPVSWLLYRSAKALYGGWDGEDEDVPDRADVRLNWVLLLNCVQMVWNMFFLAAVNAYLQNRYALLTVAFFLLSFFFLILLQQKVVDLTRRMNPEKQGSVYDVKFRRKWLDSCDEAERRQIGQAAYRAYRAAGGACMILWLVLVVLNLVLDTGLLPVFLVMLLWGIMQVSYILECIRLSRRGRDGQIF